MGDSSVMQRLDTAIPISDGRVTLRALTRTDQQACLAWSAEDGPVTSDHAGDGGINETISLALKGAFDKRAAKVFAIACAESDQFHGCALLFNVRTGEAEVGYWIAPPFRGRGLASRALSLLERVAISADVRRLLARALASDAASRRVLQKAGFGVVDSMSTEFGELLSLFLHLKDLEASPNPDRALDV